MIFKDLAMCVTYILRYLPPVAVQRRSDGEEFQRNPSINTKNSVKYLASN